jgi:hypothetical protein
VWSATTPPSLISTPRRWSPSMTSWSMVPSTTPMARASTKVRALAAGRLRTLLFPVCSTRVDAPDTLVDAATAPAVSQAV